MMSDRELWACANQVLQQHGSAAPPDTLATLAGRAPDRPGLVERVVSGTACDRSAF